MRTPIFQQGLLSVVTLDARCNACGVIRLSVVARGPDGHVTFCHECALKIAERCESIGLNVTTTVEAAVQRALRKEG